MSDVSRMSAGEREPRNVSLSGMTEGEAKEFHRVFLTSFIIFVVIAIIAHFLVWQWRPWLPEEGGYSSIADGVSVALGTVLTHLS